MHARSREEPLPARAHSRLGYGVSGDTHHGCFKTFQALAQRPRPGLRRLHHSSAGQVCLVSYQHTYPRETTEALHLTGSLGGQLETEKSKQTDFRGVKQQRLRGAAGLEEEGTIGRRTCWPRGPQRMQAGFAFPIAFFLPCPFSRLHVYLSALSP